MKLESDMRAILGQVSAFDIDYIVRVFHRAFFVIAIAAGLAAYVASRIPRVALWQTQTPPPTEV